MSNVRFGNGTVQFIASHGGVVNPSPEAQKIMMNSSWPVYVTGPNQIAFHLSSPFVWFPATLVAIEGLALDSQFVLDHGGFGTASQVNTYFNQHPIPGTSPYTVTQVSLNAFVKLAQNPSYWGANLSASEIKANPYFEPGHVKNILINYKTDDVSRYTDLSQGTAQLAAIQPSDWSLITSNPQTYSYATLPPWGSEVFLLGLNTHTYPTNITYVRQAIAHAINYTDLAQKGYLGQLSPYVGPESPGWKDYYDLGNFPPYSYNLTLAQQYLAKANITSMPTFQLRIYANCQVCINAAQVIQADLSQIGISVNVDVLQVGQFLSPYGSYQTNVQNADQIGQLAFLDGGSGWGPYAPTPGDLWFSFVSNSSLWGNFAAYSNPTVQTCVNAFTNTSNTTMIQSICKDAQAQIYNDVPYLWIGVDKVYSVAGGSIVWKNGVIKSFYLDTLWLGQTDLPMLNTVTFG